jgi:hypothetical protein
MVKDEPIAAVGANTAANILGGFEDNHLDSRTSLTNLPR